MSYEWYRILFGTWLEQEVGGLCVCVRVKNKDGWGQRQVPTVERPSGKLSGVVTVQEVVADV